MCHPSFAFFAKEGGDFDFAGAPAVLVNLRNMLSDEPVLSRAKESLIAHEANTQERSRHEPAARRRDRVPAFVGLRTGGARGAVPYRPRPFP